jgi:hypothetical protein
VGRSRTGVGDFGADFGEICRHGGANHRESESRRAEKVSADEDFPSKMSLNFF